MRSPFRHDFYGLVLFIIAFLLSCNNTTSKNNTDTEAKSDSSSNLGATSNSENIATKAGFFYFELTPTATSKDYYFSQVVLLTYKDNSDLGRQQDSCMLLLRAKAGNPADYNQESSLEHTTFSDADDERKDNIKHLKDTGNKVIEKAI